MRYLIGIFIILLGVGFFLGTLGVTDVGTIMSVWWPALIIGVGFLSLLSNKQAWFGPLIIIMIGVVFLLSNLDAIPGSFWNYFWPVVIILIGIRILNGRINHKSLQELGEKGAFVVFSGIEKHVSGPFDGCSITTIFGGAKIDLKDAEIAENARINVFSAFGGSEIILPRTVRVSMNVVPLFGGGSNKTQPDTGTTKTLRVSGTALFGGVEVKN